MRIATTVAILAGFISLGAAGCATTVEVVPEGHIAPNDNRKPAGTLTNGVLNLSLEARKGTFYPEGSTGVGVPAFAWAESGQPMQSPGPLIRVKAS
jgi:hypothetical protein